MLIYKAVKENLLLGVLNRQYTSENSVIIFKVKEKELLIVTKLLSITANKPSKVKGTRNTVYPLRASHVLK